MSAIQFSGVFQRESRGGGSVGGVSFPAKLIAASLLAVLLTYSVMTVWAAFMVETGLI